MTSTQQTSSSKEDGGGGGGGVSNTNSNGSLQSASRSSSSATLLAIDATPSNPIILRFRNVISIKRRTIYVLYFIAFLDLLSVSLFMPLLNAEIRSLGASHFMTGLIGSAYGAIQLFSSPAMGRGSDKYGQKPVLVMCLLATAFAYVIQGVAISMAFMLFARALAGVFKHTQTIGKSIVSELSPKDKSFVIGNFNAFGSMGFILGPTLGAHLVLMEHGFRLICCLASVILVVNAVLLLVLVPDPSKFTPTLEDITDNPAKKKKKSKTPASGGGSIKNADIHTMVLLLVRFLFSFATLVFRETLGFVLKEKYHTQVVDNGYITSLQALMSTVIGFAVGPVNEYVYKGNSLYMVLVSGVLKTMALFVLFWSQSFGIATAMLVTISGLNPFLRVGVTALSLEGHQNEIGTILGLSQSATSLARMFSPAISGFAVGMSHDGPFLVAAISSTLAIIATLCARKFTQRKDEEAEHVKTD